MTVFLDTIAPAIAAYLAQNTQNLLKDCKPYTVITTITT